MKAVIQRVLSAQVTVDKQIISSINQGLITFLGFEKGDTNAQAQKLIEKILNYRIFEDHDGKMNLSLLDLNLEHLIVSQFTIAADTTKGRRPSFTQAETPMIAKELYKQAIYFSQQLGAATQSGQFQADMKVSLVNDGPVTFILQP